MGRAELVVWIEGPPTVEIDGDGVKLVLKSGRTEFVSRMSRASFAQMLRTGANALTASDLRQHGNVVDFAGGVPRLVARE